MSLQSENLQNLKYAELRKLAKERGIRGNLKADKLIAALIAQEHNEGHIPPEDNEVERENAESFQADKLIAALIAQEHNEGHIPPEDNEVEGENAESFQENTLSDLNNNSSMNIASENNEMEHESELKIHAKEDCEMKPASDSKVCCVSMLHEMESESKPKVNLLLVDHEMEPEHSWKSEVNDSKPNSNKDKSEDTSTSKSRIPKLSYKTRTPRSSKKEVLGKRPRTPNFARIHQTAFEKMESIDEYVKKRYKRTEELGVKGDKIYNLYKGSKYKEQRNELLKPQKEAPKKPQKEAPKKPPKEAIKKSQNEAIKKSQNEQHISYSQTPAKRPSRKTVTPHSGIKFIPNMAANKTFNFTTRDKSVEKSKAGTRQDQENIQPPDQNTSQGVPRAVFRFGKTSPAQDLLPRVVSQPPRKPAFDLKASLARKLPYKPYSGPLKPVADTGNGNNYPCSDEKTIPTKIREKNREVLRGVRRNKRFELQMSYRTNVS